MKLTITPIPVPVGETEFTVQIREPGVVRHVAFGASERLVSLSGKPEFEERLVMFVEVSPDGPLRNRNFAVMLPGHAVNPKDGYKPVWQGTAIAPQSGSIAHLYEIKPVS